MSTNERAEIIDQPFKLIRAIWSVYQSCIKFVGRTAHKFVTYSAVLCQSKFIFEHLILTHKIHDYRHVQQICELILAFWNREYNLYTLRLSYITDERDANKIDKHKHNNIGSDRINFWIALVTRIIVQYFLFIVQKNTCAWWFLLLFRVLSGFTYQTIS